MKNSTDLRGCYPPRPSASMNISHLDLQNSLYPTRPYSIIIANNGIISTFVKLFLFRCQLPVKFERRGSISWFQVTMADIIFMKILDTKVPWWQRFFFIFLPMRWENHSREAANASRREKSRKTSGTRVLPRETSSAIFACKHGNPTTYCSSFETNHVPGNPVNSLDDVHLWQKVQHLLRRHG